MPNYVLRLAFLGTGFHGWQVQPGLRTVQGLMVEKLERVFGQPIRLTGCCRTDSGVHAKDYVANFQADRYIEPQTLLRALNSLLPDDVGVKKVWIEEGFNARYGVKGKVYLYRFFNSHSRDPFLEPFVWRIPYRLDFERMFTLVDLFVGRHDFSGFAKLEEEKSPYVEVQEVSLTRVGELIEFRIRAGHYLRYMVRRIAGCLLYSGLGKVAPEELRGYLEGRGRCPFTAKAKGLTLEKVIL